MSETNVMNLPFIVQKKDEFLNEAQIELIKNTIAKNASNDELKLFIHQCKKMGLDPLAKQIYFQKYGEKMTIIVSIDGYRLIAGRTGEYAGCDDAVFEYTEDKKIIKATVTVYRIVAQMRCAFTASARWNEYCPPAGRDTMWRKMPYTMLAKVAESLALRKAFPAELSGSYVNEEMEQAAPTMEMNEVTGEVTPVIESHRIVTQPQANRFKAIAASKRLPYLVTDKILAKFNYKKPEEIALRHYDELIKDLQDYKIMRDPSEPPDNEIDSIPNWAEDK